MNAEHTHYKDKDGTVWQIDGYGFVISPDTGREAGTRDVFMYTADGEGPKRVSFAPSEWSEETQLDMGSKGYEPVVNETSVGT